MDELDRTVAIGSRVVGRDRPVFVIAEAGVNHNGDVTLAERLVDAAADAGADAVKFQTFRASRIATSDAPKARYQRETTDAGESQLEMLARLELGEDELRRVVTRCRERDIIFLSSVGDEDSVGLLEELGVPAIKVGSAEVTNRPLLERIAAAGLPVILSTGMATLDEAKDAASAFDQERLVVLHCTSNYPADPADANLRAMATLRRELGVPVGYSDHTPGNETALAAVALGACVLEKHLTLDRSLPGPDHRASVEPQELRELVDAVRLVESALGDGVKRPKDAELDTRTVARRSLVAARDLAAGETLTPELLVALRPGTGIAPDQLGALVGRTLSRAVASGAQLQWDDLA